MRSFLPSLPFLSLGQMPWIWLGNETENVSIFAPTPLSFLDQTPWKDTKKRTVNMAIFTPSSLSSLDQTAWMDMKKGIVFAMGDDLFTENPRIAVHHSLTLAGDEAWILTIKDVTEADAGKYMCSLSTPVSLRRYYRLTVVGECCRFWESVWGCT